MTVMPQESVLGPLFFLIYDNDLTIQTLSYFQMTLFFFSVVNDINISTNNSNEDLTNISDWAAKWKISLNPDPN